MKKIKDTETAVALFGEYAIKRGIAAKKGDYKKNNFYFTNVMKIAVYLYQQNNLTLLSKYLDYDDDWLKLITAYVLLPIQTKQCVSVLKSIRRKKTGIVSFNAEMTLKQWKKNELVFPYDPDYNW